MQKKLQQPLKLAITMVTLTMQATEYKESQEKLQRGQTDKAKTSSFILSVLKRKLILL